MASKYFKSRAKSSKTIVPAGSKNIFNDPNIDEKYKEAAQTLSMSLLKSGESLLGSFNSNTVNAIPESIVSANDELTRLNDRTIPQSFKVAKNQVDITKNKYLDKINRILSSIKSKVVSGKKNRGSITGYFGKIDPSSGTFYQRIIKYDSQDNPVYDMRVSIDDNLAQTEIEIKITPIKTKVKKT
jgi:hypothetical protein